MWRLLSPLHMCTQLKSVALVPWTPTLPLTKAKAAITQGRSLTPSGLLLQPLKPWLCPSYTEVITIEPRRSPGLCLAPALAFLTLSLPTTKMVATSAFQERMWPTFASDPVLPPNLMGPRSLCKYVLTQRHTFKVGIGNCFP